MRLKRQTPGMVQASDVRTSSAKSRTLHRELHGKTKLAPRPVIFLVL